MFKKLIGFCLLAAMLLSFAACRPSPVLEEIIYEQEQEEVDPSEEIIDPEDEGVEDEDIDDEIIDDADTQREDDISEGIEGEEDTAETSIETSYSESAIEDMQAEAAPIEVPEDVEVEIDDSVSEGSETAENPDIYEDVISGKSIVDAAGREVIVPENVDTVTAVSGAAQLMMVLGASEKLLAADAEFLSSPIGTGAESLWTLRDSGVITLTNLERLIELAPDVCFEISGETTFTSSQAQAIMDAGISYVVLPDFTSIENLVTAANLMAQVLGGDTQEKADEYISYINKVSTEVSRKTAGTEYTTIYISHWDRNVSYQLSQTQGAFDSEGTGLAVGYSPTKSQLGSAFMQVAGVTNETTRLRSMHRDGRYVYITPMFHQLNAVVTGGMGTFYSGAGEVGAAYDLFVSRLFGSDTYVQLGQDQFPAIVVASSEIKTRIEGDFFWQVRPSDSSGYVDIAGISFYRGVSDEFDIYVAPSYFAPWADCTLEAPLLAYWTAYKFSGAYTLDEVKEEAAQFYSTFFSINLSGQELTAIFGE